MYSSITDNRKVKQAELWYKTSITSVWIRILMDPTGVANQYMAQIPYQSTTNTKVWYYIYSEDLATPPNSAKDPYDAPDTSYPFIAGYTGTEEITNVPNTFFVSQNYPNPFTELTEIEYRLPKLVYVSIAIYTLSGQRVAALVDGVKIAGYHTVRWDGKDDTGQKVATGVYFYRLTTDEYVVTRKMYIVK